MKISNIPFSSFPMLAKNDRAYAEKNPILKKFYKYDADIQSFAQVIADKSKDKTDRVTLVDALKNQYQSLTTEGPALQNIDTLLSENTFTVTTAHQPSLFLGPLYFVYKIFSTIRLAERLNEFYPQNHFVPVFVIGGEDHDFEEVNHINIFNKKITWERPATEGGAVGMMKTESLRPALDELKTLLGESDNAKQIFNEVEQAYTQHAVYHTATQDLINRLFGKYGLVVLNMNDVVLKRLFIPIMKQEIAEQPSKKLVDETQRELESLGLSAQAFPREINLFYLKENLRERIVEENGVFKALNTDYQWNTLEDILKEVEETPQYFSPNVVLRPLYQETVLPNLAYIGGGGEIAYWLERQTQFAYFGVNFPMLIRRNSAIWLDKGSQDRLNKIGLQLLDLVQDTDVLIKQYIAKNATEPLSMEEEKAAISQVFETVLKKAMSIDPTLEKAVLAEKTKQVQSIEAIESRILKAEKQKHDVTLNQIRALQQKLFPNGGLQERVDNFMPYFLKHGAHYFDVLKENLDPLQSGFVLIEE